MLQIYITGIKIFSLITSRISLQERRRRAIQEIARVLGKGGRALIYVWARDQQLQNKMSTYLKQNRKNRQVQTNPCPSHSSLESMKPLEETLSEASISMHNHTGEVGEVAYDGNLPLPVHVNRTNFQHNDVLVPWKRKVRNKQNDDDSGQKTFLRYYHVFEADELKRLCTEVPQIQVLDSKYDQGNWTVLLRKLP